jgi:hypothetical protein
VAVLNTRETSEHHEYMRKMKQEIEGVKKNQKTTMIFSDFSAEFTAKLMSME